MNNKETISAVNYCPRPHWERWTGSNRCPNCGGAEIEYNTCMILASNPPQNQLRCKDCGRIFSSGFDALDKPWQHDQSILGIPRVGDWPPAPTPCDPPYYPDIDIPGKNSKVGWICPKCGRCLAPHLNVCIYCEGK